jgi:hypothetical protein
MARVRPGKFERESQKLLLQAARNSTDPKVRSAVRQIDLQLAERQAARNRTPRPEK